MKKKTNHQQNYKKIINCQESSDQNSDQDNIYRNRTRYGKNKKQSNQNTKDLKFKKKTQVQEIDLSDLGPNNTNLDKQDSKSKKNYNWSSIFQGIQTDQQNSLITQLKKQQASFQKKQRNPFKNKSKIEQKNYKKQQKQQKNKRKEQKHKNLQKQQIIHKKKDEKQQRFIQQKQKVQINLQQQLKQRDQNEQLIQLKSRSQKSYSSQYSQTNQQRDKYQYIELNSQISQTIFQACSDSQCSFCNGQSQQQRFLRQLFQYQSNSQNQSVRDNRLQQNPQKNQANNKQNQAQKEQNTQQQSQGSIQVDYRCSICMQSITQKTKLSCKHCFCNECVLQWFKKTSRCPLCRQYVTYYKYKGEKVKVQKRDYQLNNYLGNIGLDSESQQSAQQFFNRAMRMPLIVCRSCQWIGNVVIPCSMCLTIYLLRRRVIINTLFDSIIRIVQSDDEDAQY